MSYTVFILQTFLESQELIPKHEHVKNIVLPEVKARPYQIAAYEKLP